MKFGVLLLRAALLAVLGLCLWTAIAKADTGVEYLMGPSAVMSHDIPKEPLPDGPHVVYVLDPFDGVLWMSAIR